MLNLLALMLDTQIPRTREEFVREIAGYPAQPEANRRAFERDKEILRGMGVPITMETIGDSTEVGYRVRPDDYCLPDLGLSADETAALRVAVSAVSLGDSTGHGALMKLGGVGDQAAAPIASLPIAPSLATLFEAFRHRAVVRFSYRGEARTLEPWGLSSKRGHWYVVGFDRVREAVRGSVPTGSRATSRSVKPTLRGTTRLPRRRTHRRPSVAARRRAGGERAHRRGCRSCPRRARRARVRRSRRVGPGTDTDTIVEVTVTNRPAFRSFVLGFLEHAEILDPPDVRAEMIDWLEAVAAGAP